MHPGRRTPHNGAARYAQATDAQEEGAPEAGAARHSAHVRRAGRCTVDLATLIARLKSCCQKAPIRLRKEDDSLRLGTTRMVLHHHGNG